MDEKENMLVELVLSGQTEAFELLVRPYRSYLTGLSYRLTGDSEESREACQETLLRAFRYLRAFDRRKSFKNWLLGILVNVCRGLIKAKQKGAWLSRALPAAEPAGPDPARLHQDKEMLLQLKDCLDVLSERERTVFLLRDIEQRSILETAGIIGCSSISVRVHLSSARKKLKDRLKGIGPGPERGTL
jgi:RNA polymerase sigma-70 factor (ECF subfamily)